MNQDAVAAAVAALSALEHPDGPLPYPDTNQGPMLVRTVWALSSISALVVGARLWTKFSRTHRLYWDDILMSLALICGFVHAAWITWAVHWGLGRHIGYLNAEQLSNTLRIGTWSLLSAFMSPMLGRIAFCVTLLFIAGTDPRMKKWPIWTFLVLQVVVNVSAIIIFYTQCGNDLALVWRPWLVLQYIEKCENPIIQTNFGYFQGSFNTLTDAFLTAVPALLIEHTRLSLRSKLGLACLLCLSVLAMIASIVKTYEAKSLSSVLDYTHDLCPYVIWMSIELNVVIIVSSIPLLRPLFIDVYQRRAEQQELPNWDTSTFGSAFSMSKKPRTTLARVDSEEEIIPQSIPMRHLGSSGITVTREVQVISIKVDNYPFVHAALVGLVEGEIANPKLTKR